jgi:glutaconate CoA-transferase subunit A
MAKYLYNQEAVENLRLSDTSILDRLVDFESAREAHLKKEHAKKDKRMTIGEAVATYVQDGDILTDGGFSYVRTAHQAFYEIIRQGKKNL